VGEATGAQAAPATADEPAERGRGGRWRRAISGLALIGVALLAAWYLRSLRAPVTANGLIAGGQPIGGVPFAELDARLSTVAEKFLDAPLTLRFGDERVRVKRRDAGFVVDRALLAEEARAVGHRGDPLLDVPERRRASRGGLDLPARATVERSRALEFLTELKEALDRAPVDARLDLEKHAIAPERAGLLVQVYESLGELEAAATSGADSVELRAVVTPSKVRKEDLAGIDISTVLATWETHYTSTGADSDRTYNLKVGAEHLNGHILKPQETFSFNEVVGDRTEKQGYRVAPVIQAGELVDGLAGGMCQIASTLHAAAFFAGLDIVAATPHSRPSAYIPLGLDSTVVYPTTDLKLRNPFDFPIVMHYSVHQGAVRVELLGKAKPYKVVFEREIVQETPFGTQTRREPEAPAGQRILLQEGYPGFVATRRRYRFSSSAALPKFLGTAADPLDKALKKAKLAPLTVEKWAVRYPSTTQMVAIGDGPRALPKRPAPPAHHIPAIPPGDKPIFRLVR